MNKLQKGLLWSAFGLTLGVTGCGFTDVTSLTSSTSKTGIVFVANHAVSRSQVVQTVLQNPPPGVSVATVTAPSTLKGYETMLRQFPASIVAIDGAPVSYIERLASQHTNVHFLAWARTSVPATTSLANVTWIESQATSSSAFLAGYAAGGLSQGTKGIQVIDGISSQTSSHLSLVSSVISGIHAAFSNSPVAVQTIISTSGAVALSSTNQMAAIVVWGDVPSAAMSAILHSGLPVIDLTDRLALQGTTQIIMRLSHTSVVAQGLRAIFRHSKASALWKQSLLVAMPSSFVMQGYTGWPGLHGLNQVATLLQRKVLSPNMFYLSVPTAQQVKTLGLPSKGYTVQGATYSQSGVYGNVTATLSANLP